MSYNTFKALPRLSVKGDAIHQLSQAAQGSREFATVRFSGAVVDGDLLTVGAKKLFIKQFNTGSRTLANTALANTNTGRINNVNIVAHGLSVGHIFRVNAEYFQVLRVGSVDFVDVQRGYAGSTVASQASGQTASVAANYTGINLTTDLVIPVGATLAIATAGPLLQAAINAFAIFGITAEYSSTGTQLLLHREAQGNTLTVAETITNATADSAFRGGVQTAEEVSSVVTRVPTAQEVTDGLMHFFFPFTPKYVEVTVVVTATLATKVWDGARAFSGKRVTLDNAGATDWAATDTVIVKAFG